MNEAIVENSSEVSVFFEENVESFNDLHFGVSKDERLSKVSEKAPRKKSQSSLTNLIF